MADEVVTTSEYELTQQDAVFVAERTAGKNSVDALIIAYEGDPQIEEWVALRDSKDRKDREFAKLMLRKKARALMNRRGIKVLTEKYQDRMAQLGDIALETLEELMVEGSSEKVRGDVAIEVARQNLGNPDKDKGGNQNVVIMIGSDPSQAIRVNNEPIEGEVVDG